MAYLMDFMEFLPPDAQKEKVLNSAEFKEWEKLREHCDMMLERGIFCNTDGRSGSLSNPEKLVLKKEERLLDAIWKKYHYIPFEMRDSALGYVRSDEYGRITNRIRHCERNIAGELHRFSKHPQVRLADIREAATKLSYMILPVCYVNRKIINQIIEKEILSKSYSSGSCIVYGIESSESLISRIEDFTKQNLYVLCPVSFYDLCRAEMDDKQREVIFGGELLQVKALLDTITQIQRNLFAILNDNEGDTGIWEIGEGSRCSENELMHLRILIETIMPIQRSLLEIVQDSKDMDSWKKTMCSNHRKAISDILRRMSKQLSWSDEAIKAMEGVSVKKGADFRKTSWILSEAAAMTDVLVFSLPQETSVMYGDGFARILEAFGVGMLENFYLNRGFTKLDKTTGGFRTSEIKLLDKKTGEFRASEIELF